MLKMLMFRKKLKKKCIAIVYYKCKLRLFSRENTKQTKSFIFIVVL